MNKIAFLMMIDLLNNKQNSIAWSYSALLQKHALQPKT